MRVRNVVKMNIFSKKDDQNRAVAGVSSPNVCNSVSANKLLQGGGKFSQQNCRYKPYLFKSEFSADLALHRSGRDFY